MLGLLENIYNKLINIYQILNLLKIIEVIRYCQPEIVLNNAVRDRHPDHGRAAKLVSDACSKRIHYCFN